MLEDHVVRNNNLRTLRNDSHAVILIVWIVSLRWSSSPVALSSENRFGVNDLAFGIFGRSIFGLYESTVSTETR